MKNVEPKNNFRNEINIIMPNFNHDLLNNKEAFKQKGKGYNDEKKNINSLKSRSQSLSTNYEDRGKNNEIKALISMKSLSLSKESNNPNEIFSDKVKILLNHFDKEKKNEANNFKFQIFGDKKKMNCDFNKIKSSGNNYSKTIIKYKNKFKYNSKELIISKSKSSSNINYINRQTCPREKKVCKKFQKSEKKCNRIKIKKLEIDLKPTPPRIPELYNNNFILYENDSKYLCNSNYYKKINKSRIPNIFYNHLIVKTKKYNGKIFSCSITKRNKGKILNIIYYKPKTL